MYDEGQNLMRSNGIVNKSLAVSGGLAVLMLIMGMLLVGDVVRADDTAVVQTSITVPVACTLRGTGTDSHTATLAPNTYSGASGSEYQNGIGKTTLTAICNDDNGFSIYAIGYTGNSYDSADHTKLVGNSLGGTIATKAYASGDTASNWSMKLTKVTDSTVSYNPANLTISTGYDAWHAIPDTYTKVAQYKANTGSSTTDTTLGVKLETTYAAFIAQNQPADTYVGQVKYTMVHPYDAGEPLFPQTAQSGCISYFPNGNNVEGTMGCQEITTSDTSAMLLASNFSRQGYGFAGWSNKFDYATNPTQDGIKFYGPQEDITFTAGQYTGDNDGLALYAIWTKSEGNLQDASKVASVCNGLTQAPTDGTANLNSVSALTDQRDNETYAIAKLADGKCWMIENLRLADTHQENGNSVVTTLTLANTNNPLNDGTNVTLKHNYTDTSTFNTLSATSAVVYNADTAPDGWCTTNSDACDDQSRIRTDNTANRATGNPNVDAGSMYSYGNYYNWYSATAGNGTFGYSTNNNSVGGDLCPTGWRLPIGGSSTNATNSDFWKYGVAVMGSVPSNNSYYQSSENNVSGDTATKALRKYPNNYLYSGYVDGGFLDSRGTLGYYWSSTASSSYSAYYLRLGSSVVNPGTNSSYKYYGRTVRCIAQ